MALKFTGRTPSASLRRPHRILSREAASRQARAWALRIGSVALVLMLLLSLAGNELGNTAPPSSSSLSSTQNLTNRSGAPLKAIAVNTRYSPVQTMGAPLLLVGETLRRSGTSGALASMSGVCVLLLLWLGLSFLGEWRKPPIGFLLLLSLQFLGFALGVAHRNEAPHKAFEYSNRPPGEAIRGAWDALSWAQQGNAVLGAMVLLAALWWWGAGLEERTGRWTGSQRAQGFLRRRRTSYQMGGTLLMMLALVGTLVVGALAFGNSWGGVFVGLHARLGSEMTWPLALLCCFVLDALFLQGLRLWHRLP
ncbi:MAG TPA: hypothetical protein VM821_00830 [Abditibacteriaceae bacterium]|nr:hypothetical protein [Abditibacteriaceae bacterium]